MFKCGVLLPLNDVTVTLITSTVSTLPLEELQAEQGKLISTTAYITIQVFKNSIKNDCRTIPTIKNLHNGIFLFYEFIFWIIDVLSTNTKHCPETTQVQFERNKKFTGKALTPKDKANQE